MQELEFVPDDSDAASLVLRVPGTTGEDSLFRVPVTDALLDRLTAPATGSADSSGSSDGPHGNAATVLRSVGSVSPHTSGDVGRSGTGGTPASGPRPAVAAVDRPVNRSAEPRDPEDPEEQPEPRKKVKLRPRDIQKRLRHGATVAELAEETGASETRLLPYAHPIEMERHRIAELARSAFPVRADGPADHTLWEILATAFGARGEDVRAAEWNAAMDSSDTWIVTVTWTRGNRRGATRFVAEFRWNPAPSPGTGPSTVEPANSVATDLIDPRFNRPVRSVAPVAAAAAGAPDEDADDVRDSHRGRGRRGTRAGRDTRGARGAEDADGTGPADGGEDDASPEDADGTPRTGSTDRDADGQDGTDGQTSGSHPAKRRRSTTTTPHWEDVLLGVRTPPRRKK